MSILMAVIEGDLAEVERLVGQDPALLNAKMERGWIGFTPLIKASCEGHVKVVRWLVDHGAAIDEQDDRGGTALWWASAKGHCATVRMLVERGADPNIATNLISGSGWTPVLVASYYNHIEVVRVLLSYPRAKPTINNRDDTGQTGLCGPASRAMGRL
jgi:ankyrin repeat protein